MFRLENKVAIVTGAARGVGEATTRLLARQGARVAAADVRFEEASRVASDPAVQGKAYAVDVSSVPEARAFVEAVADEFGRIDVLVNNAGVCPRLPFPDCTEADWERLMSVNARSQFFLMQAVCP